ncbi:penicillin acylase family protein [Polymorphobacter sp. PAMC 29334]|uniref:penicillin acylase family protein n=1 Tax=Polymorphobacter sp. PAMC 29334 TaxID=2862331 RepID=UPI001C77D14F|nr:penicillin acylase family protein [Polymorphobacter sp. PAMC 29334]QYE36270.1 penicillin acylase family protein [Polymorphobacter sp. PAMC 29334]
MRVWQKSAVGLVVFLVLVAIGLIVWEPLTAASPAPDTKVAHDARIRRDSFGVPHIDGKTDADVAYGLAYAEAEDDFHTIEELLAAIRGRSAAISGAEGAKIDYVGALIDARGTAAAKYDTLSPATRALVEAYAAGINRYADTHASEVRLSNLFPVTGHDVVAGFALRSPFFFGLDRTLGALSADKLPPRDASPASERGSNGFAVTAARSTDATTRLISNSHQPWTGGVAWYEAVVHSGEGWDFAGALFPGAPFVLLGHNKTLGWTNTVNRPDLIDTYKLVMSTDGTHYRYDGQWLPLETHRVWLRVRFGPFVLPVPKTIARSRQGPVVTNKLGSFAVRYTGFGDVRQIEQYYRLNKARDFGEWRAAMAMQAVPATNFIYADAAGHIAMVYNALFPHRTPGFDWLGVLPGDTSRDVWTGYEPVTADPIVVDPKSGWVANSNNTPFVATGAGDNLDPSSFLPAQGIETYMTNRAYRFRDLFAGVGAAKISREDLLRIKFDKGYSRQSWAGTWLARVLAVDPRGDANLVKAQALLRTWDWKLDGANAADTLAMFVLSSAAGQGYRGDPLPDAHEKLAADVAFLMTHAHRLDPPLGDMLRVIRGTTNVPILGGPEELRAVYSKIDDKRGKRVADLGDSYIMLVEWKDGQVHSESISPYGAAIERPGSRHYSDQSAMFAAEKFKPVWFSEAELAGHVERDYRP